VVADIAATGKPAFYEPDVEQIIGRVKGLAREGDIVVVFSNGGFENIHSRLLAAL
jgi:UDP-N-acetylmuramate: L-alanyl-gamma-D-glutamyl-meso-diaminopimelate ligase